MDDREQLQRHPEDTSRTTIDKAFWPLALLVYLLLVVLIVILWLSKEAVILGDPELIFDIPILLGTGIGGVGTTLAFAKAFMRKEGWASSWINLAATIGFWGVLVGTAGKTFF